MYRWERQAAVRRNLRFGGAETERQAALDEEAGVTNYTDEALGVAGEAAEVTEGATALDLALGGGAAVAEAAGTELLGAALGPVGIALDIVGAAEITYDLIQLGKIHFGQEIPMAQIATPAANAAQGGVSGEAPDSGKPPTLDDKLVSACEFEELRFKKKHRFVIYNVQSTEINRPVTGPGATNLDRIGWLTSQGYFEIPDLHPAFYTSVQDYDDFFMKSHQHKIVSANWKITQADIQHLAESNPAATIPQDYAQNPPQPCAYIAKNVSQMYHGRIRYWNDTQAGDLVRLPEQTPVFANNYSTIVASRLWDTDWRTAKLLPLVDFVYARGNWDSNNDAATGLNAVGNQSLRSNASNATGITAMNTDYGMFETPYKVKELVGLSRNVKVFSGWKWNTPMLIKETHSAEQSDFETDITFPFGSYDLVDILTVPDMVGPYFNRMCRPMMVTLSGADMNAASFKNVRSCSSIHYTTLLGQDFSNTQTCRWVNPYEAATYHINDSNQHHEPTFIRLDYLLPRGSYQPISRLEMTIETELVVQTRDLRWNRQHPILVSGGSSGPCYDNKTPLRLVRDGFYSPVLQAQFVAPPGTAGLNRIPGCGAGWSGRWIPGPNTITWDAPGSILPAGNKDETEWPSLQPIPEETQATIEEEKEEQRITYASVVKKRKLK